VTQNQEMGDQGSDLNRLRKTIIVCTIGMSVALLGGLYGMYQLGASRGESKAISAQKESPAETVAATAPAQTVPTVVPSSPTPTPDASPKAQPAIAAKVVQPATVPVKKAVSVTPSSESFGLIIGRIYTKEQRAVSKSENLPALVECSKEGVALALCFKEVGDKKRSRFQTQVLAVTESGMNAAQMQAAKTCLNEKLPKIVKRDANGAIVNDDEGKPARIKILPDTVLMSTYTADQPCLTE
jgi:hypothetical protein